MGQKKNVLVHKFVSRGTVEDRIDVLIESKQQHSTTIASLLATVELVFESERIVEIALALFKKNTADLADCLHIASAYVVGETPTRTFDRVASKIDGAKFLANSN
jgi:predicted nucleic-acid-binding protein